MKIKIGERAFFEKTISEADVYQFAGITGDFNPLHINKVEAEKTVFGERIAHGMLVGGLISGVIGMQMPGNGTIYLEQNCKFKRPVKIGDTVTVKVEFTEIINREKGIIKLENVVTNQLGDVVIEGYSVVKVLGERLEGGCE